jgi:hypothetical protein
MSDAKITTFGALFVRNRFGGCAPVCEHFILTVLFQIQETAGAVLSGKQPSGNMIWSLDGHGIIGDHAKQYLESRLLRPAMKTHWLDEKAVGDETFPFLMAGKETATYYSMELQ